ncbi:hypothetical protein [Nonomuraea salmonea]|uniref:hypothetical protein n=1 Tax=Nonomuraea salmonea TaxID=46181 RepID=UPI002FEAC057
MWDGGACFPKDYTGGEPGQPWTTTLHTLQTLQIFGLDPESPQARQAVALVGEHGRWEHAGQRYFDGEVEPCINGRTVETGAYFGVDVSAIVARLLDERLADGGWNCEAENGSVRSSFHTTLGVLDGLLEYERATGADGKVREARRAGEEFLLERGLFRRRSTGEVADPAFLEFAFPYYWRHDVLRALDYFRRSGGPRRTPGWRRPWRSSRRSGSPTAAGRSTGSTRDACISRTRRASGGRAAGTPCARSGCSPGGRAEDRARTKAPHEGESAARRRKRRTKEKAPHEKKKAPHEGESATRTPRVNAVPAAACAASVRKRSS